MLQVLFKMVNLLSILKDLVEPFGTMEIMLSDGTKKESDMDIANMYTQSILKLKKVYTNKELVLNLLEILSNMMSKQH